MTPCLVPARLAKDLLGVFAACALAWSSGCATSTGAHVAPSSSVPRDRALRLAQLTAASVGGQVFAVAATGSMKPTLDECSIVAVEKTAFDELRTGDIVIYRSRTGVPIIHRLYTLQGQTWLVLGDNNAAIDPEAVTAGNLVGRVCAIFYTASSIPDTDRAFASNAAREIPMDLPKIH